MPEVYLTTDVCLSGFVEINGFPLDQEIWSTCAFDPVLDNFDPRLIRPVWLKYTKSDE